MSDMTTLPTISLCICTRNRPEDLAEALASVRASSLAPLTVIVADDSTDDRTRTLVAAEFPEVVFVEGPRRGLGANRNAALAMVHSSHVAFIDDDARLDREFLALATVLLAREPAGTIVSGIEWTNGTRTDPHGVSYLGFQSLTYRPGEPHRTVVINSTVFPRALFDAVPFDPHLVYGCDEIDLCQRALAQGYRIVFDDRLANRHFPSPVNRGFYAPYHDASRIYVRAKALWWQQRRPVATGVFLGVALAHNLAHRLRRERLAGLGSFVRTVWLVFGWLRAPGHPS